MTTENYDKLSMFIFLVIPFLFYNYAVFRYVKSNYLELKKINFSTFKVLKNKNLRPGLIKIVIYFFLLIIYGFCSLFLSPFLGGYLRSIGFLCNA